jgi:hypothetical protein
VLTPGKERWRSCACVREREMRRVDGRLRLERINDADWVSRLGFYNWALLGQLYSTKETISRVSYALIVGLLSA